MNRTTQPLQPRGHTLPLRWCVLVALCLLCRCDRVDRHHYVGPGRPTPQAAWQAWVEAVETQNYPLVRDVVRWTGPECGGMEMIALNPHQTRQIDLYLNDHVDHSAASMGNVQGPLYRDHPRDTRFAELWQQRIKPFRDALILSLPVIRAAKPKPIDADTWIMVYPRASYDADHHHLGFDEKLSNEIHIKRHNGAWYITDFSCHAMNESWPQGRPTHETLKKKISLHQP